MTVSALGQLERLAQHPPLGALDTGRQAQLGKLPP
jgi:hypothetical protein